MSAGQKGVCPLNAEGHACREQDWALKAALVPEGGPAVDLLLFNKVAVLEPVLEALPEASAHIRAYQQHASAMEALITMCGWCGKWLRSLSSEALCCWHVTCM